MTVPPSLLSHKDKHEMSSSSSESTASDDGENHDMDREDTESNEDVTMRYSSGSVVFSVQGVQFKQHSAAFSSMLDMNGTEDEIVTLEDSVNGFRQFRAVLFTPFESCLATTNPNPAQILNLLDLLVITHKYCMEDLEALALEKLIPATLPQTLAYCSASLQIRILDVATTINSEQLQRAPRASLLYSLRSQRADEEACLAVLALGKKLADRELLGAAYYSIMRLGREWWMTCESLAVEDKTRIMDGMIRCAEEWQRITTQWGESGFGCHPGCSRKRDVLDASLRIQALQEVQWYDIVGKLAATIDANGNVRGSNICEVFIADNIAEINDRVKRDLPDFFLGTLEDASQDS